MSTTSHHDRVRTRPVARSRAEAVRQADWPGTAPSPSPGPAQGGTQPAGKRRRKSGRGKQPVVQGRSAAPAAGGQQASAQPRVAQRPAQQAAQHATTWATAVAGGAGPAVSFAALGVDPELVSLLAESGINSPRPIQADTLKPAMAGRDVCGRAPTGSGKTLAFALPLAHLTPSGSRPVGMVLAPTRELAVQIAEVLQPLAGARGMRVVTLIGGTNINTDISRLRRGVDLIVGCPGRMLDLVNRRELDLGGVRTAVLDEADRMADMGFIPDVRRLLNATGCRDGQLLLFSATLDATTRKLEDEYTRDAVHVDVDAAPEARGDVAHTWYRIDRDARREVLEGALDAHRSAIVFTRTKRGAGRLARQLTQSGRSAAAIHGDRSQSQRQKALARFAEGSARILVATDVAARGIHVDGVDLVVHYDLPATAEDYTHRSGRTGRAGADGAVVLLTPRDQISDADALWAALRRTTPELHPTLI